MYCSNSVIVDKGSPVIFFQMCICNVPNDKIRNEGILSIFLSAGISFVSADSRIIHPPSECCSSNTGEGNKRSSKYEYQLNKMNGNVGSSFKKPSQNMYYIYNSPFLPSPLIESLSFQNLQTLQSFFLHCSKHSNEARPRQVDITYDLL